MLPTLAQVEALEARLGVSFSGTDFGRALGALQDASALIRAEAGQDWLDDDGNPDFGGLSAAEIATLESVCLAVALRAYRNPSGAVQSSVGDVSVSFGRDSATGAVFLTEADRRVIRRVAGLSSVVAVALTTPYMGEAVNYYVPVDYGGDPFPLGLTPGEAVS